MGAYFSKENWQGAALILLFTLVGVGAGKRIAAETEGMIIGYISLFAACFFIVYLASVAGFYLGTRARCATWPSASTILQLALIPAIIASVSTLGFEIASDFLKNKLIAIMCSIASWTGPFMYNLYVTPVAIAVTSCGAA